MQAYLQYLIEDIRKSAQDKNNNRQYADGIPISMDVPEQLSHLDTVPMYRAGKWLGLSSESFPPAEKWDDQQLLELCVTLRALFEHYQIAVRIPHGLPFKLVYTFLIKALDEYVTCMEEGQNEISFCSETGTCPFGVHCTMEENEECDTWELGVAWEGDFAWEAVREEQQKKE
jgi:hypothetical protein